MALAGDSRDISELKFSEVEAYIGFNAMEAHKRYIDMLMWAAANGIKVILISGNHDINLKLLDGQNIENIDFRERIIIEINGKLFLAEHGHESDPEFIKDNPGLYNWGSKWLDRGMIVDRGFNKILFNPISHVTRIGALRDTFMITNFLKFTGKGYIGMFRENAAGRAEALGLHGSICGHIHRCQIGLISKKLFMTFDSAIGAAAHMITPQLDMIEGDGIIYLNTGDGFNHGTVLIQTGNPDDGYEGWIHKTRSDVPLSRSFVIDQPNPYAAYRQQTDRFLEAGWQSLVEYVHNPEKILKASPDKPEPALRGRVPIWDRGTARPREKTPELEAA